MPVDTPFLLQTLLRRCLRKDPHKRLRDISVALIELEDATAGGALPPEQCCTPGNM